MKLVMIHDLIEENGKTIRENNLERQHAIPIGSLVEIKFDEWMGEGACWKVHARLWVVLHSRDCDGTPLYGISRWNDPQGAQQVRAVLGGFSEESLTIIQLTDAVRRGDGALAWPDDA